MEDEVIVKKVNPYPFDITLDREGRKINGKVLKITLVGLLMDSDGQVMKVGAQWQATFRLPAQREDFIITCKVMKTYDTITKDPSLSKKMAEVHFIKPSEGLKEAIKAFVNKIKQK